MGLFPTTKRNELLKWHTYCWHELVSFLIKKKLSSLSIYKQNARWGKEFILTG
jgi:hypothetical protein